MNFRLPLLALAAFLYINIFSGVPRVSADAPASHSMQPHGSAIHRPEMATHVAVASGNWSDPAVWQDGEVPDAFAQVHIPAAISVTVDTRLTPDHKIVMVDGALRFAPDVDTELRADTLTTGGMGLLEIGTADTPIASNVTARIVFSDLGAIDLREDPKQLGRGAVLSGQTIMFGAEKTHRITAGVFPQAGDSQLQLSEAPVGWRVGDVLVITGSQGSTSDEVRTITAVDGSIISLDRPLELDHVPPKASLNLWIANTTRNIQIESENPALMRRGHIMFHHTTAVDVNYAGFYNLGRTNKQEELDDFYYEIDDERPGNDNPAPIYFEAIPGPATNIRGRYAIHFHRTGTDATIQPGIVNGSVVVDSPGWGMVNHSSNVHMLNNVTYDVQGAGFYTEAGDEVGSMVGNIAIRTVNETFVLDDLGAIDPDLGLDLGDFGRDGDGFWLSGTRVAVIDNVAAGASAHGIIFWVDGLIEPDTGRAEVRVDEIENGHLITNRDTIPVWWAPLAEVRDNEAYGATVGFRSRYIHSATYMGDPTSEWHAAPPKAYVDTLNPVFDGITVWGSRDGILLNYNERLSVRNAELVGIGADFQHNLGETAAIGVGLDLNNPATFGPGVVENITIEGYEVGFLAPRQERWAINNLHLGNTTDMIIHAAVEVPRTMPMTNITFGSLDGTAVAGQAAQRQHIVLDPAFENIDEGIDFVVFPDLITLDGQEVYFNEQRAGYVPLNADELDIDEEELGELLEDEEFLEEFEGFNVEYIGKTNAELMALTGSSFGGELLPDNAIKDPRIVNGKIAPGGPAPAVPESEPTRPAAVENDETSPQEIASVEESAPQRETVSVPETTEAADETGGIPIALWISGIAMVFYGGTFWFQRRHQA